MPARFSVTRRSGTYNWQLRYYVPRRMQKAFGKEEVVRSLQTPDKGLADERALDVVKKIIAEVRAAQTPPQSPPKVVYFEPTDEQIEAAVREVYEAEVESDFEERADPDHMSLMGLGGKQSAKTYRAEAKRLRKAAAMGDFSVADLDYWSEHFGFDLSKNTAKQARFHQALAYALAEAAERWADHDMGKLGIKPALPELRRPKGHPKAAAVEVGAFAYDSKNDIADETNNVSIRELWESHERQLGSRVKPSTLLDRKVSVDLFSEFVGHRRSVSSITRADARKWRELLYKYPTMAAQRSVFKDKPFDEVVVLNEKLGYDPISATTVSKHLSGVSTFFKWLCVEGYIDRNIFDGLSPRLKLDGKKRAAFSEEQLRRLFKSPLFTGCSGEGNIIAYSTPGSFLVRDWRFWLPLMSAFSAARLSELAQLEVSDVRKIEGIYCLDINADGEGDKTLKSEWSKRLVPVHSQLLKVGFGRFVDNMRSKGAIRLFPELDRDSLGSFSYASKWFGKYLKRMEFEPNSRDEIPVFHSFRHSAVTQMGKELGDSEIQPLIGHEALTTTKGYREAATYSVEKRQRFIELIKYDGLNLRGISR